MKAIAVREMTEADIPAVAALHIGSWRRHYRGLLPSEYLGTLSIERCEHQWRTRLADGERATFERVVLYEDTLAGFAIGQPDPGGHELRAFYTDTARDFLVLPTLFMRHMLGALYSRTPAVPVHLWVLQANRQAREFFEAVGFHADGVTRADFFGLSTVPLARHTLAPGQREMRWASGRAA